MCVFAELLRGFSIQDAEDLCEELYTGFVNCEGTFKSNPSLLSRKQQIP